MYVIVVYTNIFQGLSTQSLDRILSTGRSNIKVMNFFARWTRIVACNTNTSKNVIDLILNYYRVRPRCGIGTAICLFRVCVRTITGKWNTSDLDICPARRFNLTLSESSSSVNVIVQRSKSEQKSTPNSKQLTRAPLIAVIHRIL